MKHRDQLKQGRKPTGLIEEAVHLLRSSPAGTLAAYYLGSLPFALGLLYFWSDMARDPFAPRHLAGGSLGLAALFLWMKFWQTIFAAGLRAQVTGTKPPPLSLARCRRILATQTALQPTSLFLLPLALLPVLPVPWVYAFYQSLTVLGDAESDGLKDLCRKAWRQGAMWPRQNIFLLLIMSGFSFYVFLNWISVGYMLPHLAKMLFGIETIYSRSGTAMMNSTFLAAMLILTWLCVDPILKAAYTLRCFYGESVSSGEDLKAELKHFNAALRGAIACLGFTLFLMVASNAGAGDPAPAVQPAATPAPEAVQPPALNQAIDQTIDQAKYTWRMPREKIVQDEEPPGLIERFVNRVTKMIHEWARIFSDWLGRLWRKLFKQPDRSSGETSSNGYDWIMTLQVLLYTLLAVVAVALALLIYRTLRDRHRTEIVTAEAIHPAPDLNDENVGADQLPEDGWTKLARELLAKGELRLALRAFYLASLAHLAERNLITLARFKSNRDYQRELQRRAHSFPALVGTFADNISVFDRSWYGRHEVTGELVNQFAANVDRLKGAA